MKARLMYRDRDADVDRPLPVNADELEQDLGLGTLLDAMARGDSYLRDRARAALHASLVDPDEILFRQQILADCLEQPALVRRLYDLAVEGVGTKKKAHFFWYRDSPDALLQKSLKMLELLADVLRRVRQMVDEHATKFRSDGVTRLLVTLQDELDDEYLRTLDYHLRELRFRRGALISASLGTANRGTSYVLRKPLDRRLRERLTPGGAPSYSFTIADRDQHGLQAIAELRGRGINHAAGALAQATDHILDFFGMLRAELGFYVGCLNLHEQLAERSRPTCFPVPLAAVPRVFSVRGLYDASLGFHLDGPVVGNDVDGDGKRLVMITGANQGGKSTFLRSVGLAQMLLQAGLFVPADSFSASVCESIFTHFKREEDTTMTHGKLDEELSRMSEIADRITPGCLLLCNESFAATNEREGSEIARHVIRAMLDAGVTVFFVTHLFDLGDSLYRERLEHALFLRAERRSDGRRTFRIEPGEPLPTSYGADSYRRIFGTPARAADVAAAADD